VLAQNLNIYNDNLQRTLPGPLIDRLRSLGSGDFEIRSWIRAQSVGYLARFNDETLAAVRASRLNATTHGYFETEAISAVEKQLLDGTVCRYRCYREAFQRMFGMATSGRKCRWYLKCGISMQQ